MNPFSARQDPTINVNYEAAQEHVPQAENIIVLFNKAFGKHNKYPHLRIYRVFW